MALQIKKEIGDKFGLARIYINLAHLHEDNDSYEAALDYLNTSFEIIESLESKNLMISLNKMFSSVYEKVNKLDLSLKYHKQYVSLLTDVYNIDKSKQISEI